MFLLLSVFCLFHLVFSSNFANLMTSLLLNDFLKFHSSDSAKLGRSLVRFKYSYRRKLCFHLRNRLSLWWSVYFRVNIRRIIQFINENVHKPPYPCQTLCLVSVFEHRWVQKSFNWQRWDSSGIIGDKLSITFDGT
jgi:hypothetical protein